MSNYLKSDYVGAFTIAPAAVQYLLASANNRGQKAFNLLAPYGGTTTTPPLSQDQMAQTYTLDAAAVDNFLNNMGVRGSEFLVAMGQVAGAPTFEVVPGPDTLVSITLTGIWEDTSGLDVTWHATGGGGDVNGTFNWRAVGDLGPVSAANSLAGLMNNNINIEAWNEQNVVYARPVTRDLLELNPVTYVPATPSPINIFQVGNTYTVQGTWQSGDQVRVDMEVTDSEGDVQNQEVIITLPPGGPWSPTIVATVIAAELDPVAFVTATAVGPVVNLSPTEPGTTLTSSATIL